MFTTQVTYVWLQCLKVTVMGDAHDSNENHHTIFKYWPLSWRNYSRRPAKSCADGLGENLTRPNINSSALLATVSKVWQYGLWSFQTGGTKLERFSPKNQDTQRKLLDFENWVNGEVSKSAKIWLSKSIFYVKNYPNLSTFSLTNTIL